MPQRASALGSPLSWSGKSPGGGTSDHGVGMLLTERKNRYTDCLIDPRPDLLPVEVGYIDASTFDL